jgi:protocatechuate 3,4-dioxygenase beta subunit
MERKHFLKTLLLGATTAPAVLAACSKEAEVTPTAAAAIDDATALAAKGGTSSSCVVMPTETEGPFPTHVPASYQRVDIRDGRTGYRMDLKLTVVSAAAGCTGLAGAIVDIWHCDAEGNYSEYGGTQMQSTNYTGTAYHFLRGRQVANANGVVSFTSIFPGWYTSRATHIHVHVYNAAGTSLLVTQISFPEGTGTALVAVNGYAKGLSGYTYNRADNVFSDDSTNLEVATVTGSTTRGFVLTKKITVR